MMNQINLKKDFYTAMNEYDKIHSEEHKHPDGRFGASGFGKGNVLSAIRKAKITGIPPLTGMKAYKGGLWVGSWEHERIQETLLKYYEKNPLPNSILIDEIYVAVPLTELTEVEIYLLLKDKGYPIDEFLGEEQDVLKGSAKLCIDIPNLKTMAGHELFIIKVPRTMQDVYLDKPEWFKELGIPIILSPIDLALISKEGFFYKKVQFRDMSKFIPFIHPLGEFIKIWDIKTAAKVGYYKLIGEEISEGYYMQFMAYMRGSRLTELSIFTVRKDNLLVEKIPIEYDNKIWEKMIDNYKRTQKIVKAIYNKDIDEIPEDTFEKEDLACISDPNGISWYFCPLSETCEEKQKNGEIRLVFKGPCKFAKYHIRKEAFEKFTEGSKWSRGRSHIEIIYIDKENEKIKSQNKSGRVFYDSIYYAYKNYK